MQNQQLEFIQFVSDLAEPGETALLLLQKPIKDAEGNVQYHADGVLKSTFPAFMPAQAKIKPGESWYINTGSFVVDRFHHERASAKRENIDFVLFMMLDDIGTKSKTPPLDPTWIMETSEGCYQWGYAFDPYDQPTKGDFTSAIKAIADAGYTDPGALNAVRNCRIPGSVNTKLGRNSFVARLVEFHPKRLYTLPQICEALGVEPAEADTAELQSIKLRDTGRDNVLQWLSDNGLVLSNVNAEGWLGVVCPNHAEHSDGNPEARYKPLDRSFCCWHAHCADLDTKTFLSWVYDNGGPLVTPGLRDELLAELHAETLSKLQPTEAFPDEAAIRIAEVERKEVGRTERTAWFERFAYVQSDDSYFDNETRTDIQRHVFNALYRHVDCRSIHNSKARVTASIYYDERRQDMGAKALVGLTYAPGDGVYMARDGLVYGNRWIDARPDVSDMVGKVTDGMVQRWLDHCRVLLPDPQELNHCFDVMAYKIKNPNRKINHAVLHGGDEGSGKDTMWAPFIWAVAGPHHKNRSVVDTDSLHSQWGYNLEAEVMILNELKEPEAKERRALANRLKPIIAAPPETLVINRKGLHPYEMINRVFVLAFTNDPVPISLPSQDRRWFCLWSTAPRMDADEATAMWHWYEKQGGYQQIAAWLHQRDVSAFNPAAAPMETDYKRTLVEQSMSVAESSLVDLIRARASVFARGVVSSPFQQYSDTLQGVLPPIAKMHLNALQHALKEAGWVDMGRLMSNDYTTKKHIYVAPEVAKNYSKANIRRMAEPLAWDDEKVVSIC